MYEVKTTAAVDSWLESLDPTTQGRLLYRLTKAETGNLGDVEPVGDGVFEMREHFGPGYRLYFIKEDKRVIVVLGGGDKSTQKKDVAKAKKLAKSMK